jgi:hypothetical protein
MIDIVKLYNPANAASLTPEQIEGLQFLSDDELKQLALAFPNKVMITAYLLIIDKSKPLNKQIPNLNTFEGLYNLRAKNGLKNYVAFNFKANYKPKTITPVKPRKTEVKDLSDTELLRLPGFKTKDEVVKPSTVEVKHIKKISLNEEGTGQIVQLANDTVTSNDEQMATGKETKKSKKIKATIK